MRWFDPVSVNFNDLRASVRSVLVGEDGPVDEVQLWSIEAEDSIGTVDYRDSHVWTAERSNFPIGHEHVEAAVRVLLGRDDVDLVECLVPSTDTYPAGETKAIVFLAPSDVSSPAEVVDVIRAGERGGPMFGHWIEDHLDLLTLVLSRGDESEVVALIDLHDSLFHSLTPDLTAFALRDRPELWPAARAAMDRAAVVSLQRSAEREVDGRSPIFAAVDRRRGAAWAQAAVSLTPDDLRGPFG